MVSAAADQYRAEIVRLEGLSGAGSLSEAAPVGEAQVYPGRVQAIHPGSYILVPDRHTLRFGEGLTIQAWLAPTLPQRGREQGIIAKWSLARQAGFGLLLDAGGHPVLRLGDGQGGVSRLAAPVSLHAGRWVFLAATYEPDGAARLTWRERSRAWIQGETGEVEVECGRALADADDAPLLIGAIALAKGDRGERYATGCYNGKIDHPRLWNRALRPGEIGVLAADGFISGAGDSFVGDWDFGERLASTTVVDRSPSGAHAVTVNMPARGVTGHLWDGSEDSFLARPEHYSAIAFHEDDLDDCAWEPDFSYDVPADLPSGLYTARLEANGDREEIPFYVRPALGQSTAPILVLAPTNTYLAYANFRLNIVHALAGRTDTPGRGRLSATDRLLMQLPDIGSSLYDSHPDGGGVFYSSRLRPIVTMRSDAIETATGGPRHFSADLCLLAWLAHKGFAYDIATDEDLHGDGADLLAPYRVVLTGGHPEYWTGPMLDALETYLAGGGRLMYLGGNGFYWVTAMDAERPHLIEIRRGTSGTRSWSSEPGEMRLSLTGEPGGLWRHRGRTPNRLCGIGFAAQGWDAAASYIRLPDSHDPRAAFIFADIGEDEIIGDFGLVLDGAAGDEVDRYDLELGTPGETLRLATSEGGHSDAYQLVIEDSTESRPDLGGTTCPKVRSDLVYLEPAGGGAVFSVGSINWIASLPHNDFANNVSRITENVVRRFTESRSREVEESSRGSVSRQA
jgi:N,N-dimethylformamidase